MIVWSDLVGEAGVGTVGVVPQLGILGVVTPGVTGSVVRIISMIICTWDSSADCSEIRIA